MLLVWSIGFNVLFWVHALWQNPFSKSKKVWYSGRIINFRKPHSFLLKIISTSRSLKCGVCGILSRVSSLYWAVNSRFILFAQIKERSKFFDAPDRSAEWRKNERTSSSKSSRRGSEIPCNFWIASHLKRTKSCSLFVDRFDLIDFLVWIERVENESFFFWFFKFKRIFSSGFALCYIVFRICILSWIFNC